MRVIISNIYSDSNWLLNMVENLLTVTRIHGDNFHINTSEEAVEEVEGRDKLGSLLLPLKKG